MKLLLIVAAVMGVAMGLVLLVIPSLAFSLLVGVPLDNPAGLVAGRIAGAAIIAVAIACWQVRRVEVPATAAVQAMLFYYVVVTLVLAYAGIRLELRSKLLWPAILLHFGFGVWCQLILWLGRRKSSTT